MNVLYAMHCCRMAVVDLDEIKHVLETKITEYKAETKRFVIIETSVFLRLAVQKQYDVLFVVDIRFRIESFLLKLF